jgi:hypothetical protein
MRAHSTLPLVNSAHIRVPAADSSPSETTQYNGIVADMDPGRRAFVADGFILQATEEDGRGWIKSSYNQR